MACDMAATGGRDNEPPTLENLVKMLLRSMHMSDISKRWAALVATLGGASGAALAGALDAPFLIDSFMGGATAGFAVLAYLATFVK